MGENRICKTVHGGKKSNLSPKQISVNETFIYGISEKIPPALKIVRIRFELKRDVLNNKSSNAVTEFCTTKNVLCAEIPPDFRVEILYFHNLSVFIDKEVLEKK